MMDLKVSIQGTVGLLNGLARADAIAQAEQQEAMAESLGWIQADARRLLEPKRDTGNLSASIIPTMSVFPTHIIGTIGPRRVYGLPVERGRNPGRWPPYQKLRLWGQRHGFLTKQSILLLRRAIARRGILPASFLVPAYLYNRQRIIERFAQVGAQIVFRVAQGTRSGPGGL